MDAQVKHALLMAERVLRAQIRSGKKAWDGSVHTLDVAHMRGCNALRFPDRRCSHSCTSARAALEAIIEARKQPGATPAAVMTYRAELHGRGNRMLETKEPRGTLGMAILDGRSLYPATTQERVIIRAFENGFERALTDVEAKEVAAAVPR